MKSTLSALALAAAALATLPGCIPLMVTGAGTAALMATDRRTTGMYIEDENIELKVLGMKDRFGNAHVNATSYNRRVLLTGEAPDEATRSKVEAELRAIPNVKEVTNEIQVAGNSSLASRGSDALITSNVKARMVNNPKFSANHVKVVTEAGTVYLMGLVTPEEGDAAVEIARTTSGVVRVVKVFEYIGK
ncbi:MAG TPA: BON domain-containing protein [Usitatibacter sp.]|jgi:osmotically-inducible protein OsmY|nr:BON domain-containing protein [Usitatibacter sp.]